LPISDLSSSKVPWAGLELQRLFGDEARVIGTVICGDGYYRTHRKSPCRVF